VVIVATGSGCRAGLEAEMNKSQKIARVMAQFCWELAQETRLKLATSNENQELHHQDYCDFLDQTMRYGLNALGYVVLRGKK
jgi:hypothetical protein